MKCVNCHDEGFFYAPDGDAPMVERYCSCPAGARLRERDAARDRLQFTLVRGLAPAKEKP